MDQLNNEIHENWYFTNISVATVYTQLIFLTDSSLLNVIIFYFTKDANKIPLTNILKL